MILALNPLRFAAMFSPIWLFVAPSLYLYWNDWMSQPWLLAGVAGLPLWAWVFARLVQDRWRLEITSNGLVHHTLAGAELFEWSRMGPVALKGRGPHGFFSALVFAFPVDNDARLGFTPGADGPGELIAKYIGRSILAIFGAMKPRDLAAYVEAQRVAHIRKR
jgi:hypothetical protein